RLVGRLSRASFGDELLDLGDGGGGAFRHAHEAVPRRRFQNAHYTGAAAAGSAWGTPSRRRKQQGPFLRSLSTARPGGTCRALEERLDLALEPFLAGET